METKEGPTFIKVPMGVTYNTCFGCEHLNRVMVRSGRDPKYNNFCAVNHSDIMREFHAEGRLISNETPPITPHWCQYLSENPRPL